MGMDGALTEFESQLRILRSGSGRALKKSHAIKLLLNLLREPGQAGGNGRLEHLNRVLSNHGRIANRRMLAGALLRLLASQAMPALQAPPLRSVVAKILELEVARVAGSDRYLRRILDKLPHELLSELARSAQDVEAHFFASMIEVHSVADLARQRSKLLSSLGQGLSKIMILPFMPPDLVSELNAFYNTVNSCLGSQETDPARIEIQHNETIAICKSLAQKLFDSRTDYADRARGKVALSVERLVEQKFQESPFLQAADLRLHFRRKKYPFHDRKEKIAIGYSIENVGPGVAYEVSVDLAEDKNLHVIRGDRVEISRINPGEVISHEAQVRVRQPCSQYEILTSVSWAGYNRSSRSRDESFFVEAQRGGIPWEQLARTDPYSLEPVIHERDLIGRTDLLNKLFATVTSPSVGSAMIKGQKRVGKTSIARVLQSQLEDESFLVVFLESGDYVERSGIQTIRRLGRSICQSIQRYDSALSHLPIPEFDEAFAPLVDYLDTVIRMLPDVRLLVILDEFDELPFELYAIGGLGNSFFQTLRSLTSRHAIGFLLVGGERMSYVISSQGQRVNKWSVLEVDYFSKETQWQDYQELVRRPTHETLEYDDLSLSRLHDATSGNPFFTKMICREIFAAAIRRRDSHVTEDEVALAVQQTVASADANVFAHFWEDHIFSSGKEAARVSHDRRHSLVAISEICNKGYGPTKLELEKSRSTRAVVDLKRTLVDLVARGIVVESNRPEGLFYGVRVGLFEKWLRLPDSRSKLLVIADAVEDLSPRDSGDEPVELSVEALDASFAAYLKSENKETIVSDWLHNFQGRSDQQAMLALLGHCEFLGRDYLTDAISSIYERVQRTLASRGAVRRIVRGKRKRDDIAIVYRRDESGLNLRCAKELAVMGNVYAANVIEINNLEVAVSVIDKVAAVVFMEACWTTVNYVEQFRDRIFEAIDAAGQGGGSFFFTSILMRQAVWNRIREVSEETRSIEPKVYRMLNENDSPFAKGSSPWPEPSQGEFAEAICKTIGRSVAPHSPLGEDGLALGILTEWGVPRSSLPVLWGLA